MDAVPSSKSVTIWINGTATTIRNFTVSGSKLVAHITSTVSGTDIIETSYTRQNDSHDLRDNAGNVINSFARRSVSNQADTDAPTLSSVEASTNVITLTYSEYLDANILPQRTDYEVLVNGVLKTVLKTTLVGKTVTLTVAGSFLSSDSITVTYKESATKMADTAGNEIASYTDKAVVNNVDSSTPVVDRAIANGKVITVVFDDLLDSQPLLDKSAFVVKVDGQSTAIDTMVIKDNTIILTLVDTIGDGQAVSFETTQGIADDALNVSTAIGETSVNNLTNITTPSVTSISTSKADGVYNVGETIQFTVTFNESIFVNGAPRIQLETGSIQWVVRLTQHYH